MQQTFSFKLLPSEAFTDSIIKKYVAEAAGVPTRAVTGYNIVKRSIDARGKQPWINLSLLAFINEPWIERKLLHVEYRDVHRARNKIIIVGAGPAGLFAALRLIEAGIQPIILERGKDVRARRRDLAILNKEGIINPDSNYCFGEGGAGTYSDGKLYTRSTKRGNVNRILNIFAHFGAEENILYEAHPHIGTNKLPQIISAMRKLITDCGGKYLFEQKVTGFTINDKKITSVNTSNGNTYEADGIILATGHSARDIFLLLQEKNLAIEFKPFALGVRVEHPQKLIDNIQYHTSSRGEFLPPASYNVVKQVEGQGVFSFCMCPGGIIAPASTNYGELVVNGWSPSKRNNPFANSGIVTTIEEKHVKSFRNYGHLAGMYFQKEIEEKAFSAGGGKFVAPAQRLVDFCENKVSMNLPACSYLPGIHSTDLKEVLPPFIHKSLQKAFRAFGKKLKSGKGSNGFYTNEAVLVATESRTSSPVRVPRNAETLEHSQIANLYPCGEGAGYAGGIVSAAMDGERVATVIANRILSIL